MTVTRSSENFNKIQVGTNAYIGPDAVTNSADFANAQMYVYHGDTGGTTGSYTGIATEAAADVSGSAIGIYSASKAFGSNSGMGVYGLGKVNATGDTATSYGGNFSSVDTHAGGDNIGVRGNAANGANNYSFYGANGDIYNAGRTLGMQGTDIASGTNIVLPSDGNVFELTGTTKVDLISNLGWNDGSEITLIANESVVIDHGTATSSTNVTINLAGAGDYSMTAGDTLKLVLCSTTAGGQAWREVSRSVN